MAETATAPQTDAAAKGNPFKKYVGAITDPKPRKPRGRPKGATTTKGKKDLSSGCTMVYGMAGGVLAMRGQVAGRVMQVQAPVAGKKLSTWIRSYDVLYNVLSPILGASEVDMVTDVLGPPLLVMMLQNSTNAEGFSPLYPVLRPLLMPMMLKLFKELKTMQQKEEEFFEELAELEEGTDMAREFEAFLRGLGLAEDNVPPAEPVEVRAEDDGDMYDAPSPYAPRHAE